MCQKEFEGALLTHLRQRFFKFRFDCDILHLICHIQIPTLIKNMRNQSIPKFSLSVLLERLFIAISGENTLPCHYFI